LIIGRLRVAGPGTVPPGIAFDAGAAAAGAGFAAATCRSKPAMQHGLFTWSESIFFKKHRASEL
jgi:hypothetical protein